MEAARLVSLLADRAGSLTAPDVDNDSLLLRVRYLVANALLSDQTEPMADPRFTIMPRLDELDVAELEEIRKVATDVATSEPDGSLRVYRVRGLCCPITSRGSCPAGRRLSPSDHSSPQLASLSGLVSARRAGPSWSWTEAATCF